MFAPLILDMRRYGGNCLKNRAFGILHNYIASPLRLIRAVWRGFFVSKASKSLFLQGNETHCPRFRTAICGRSRPSTSIAARRDSVFAQKTSDEATRNCQLSPQVLGMIFLTRTRIRK
jgi:hypothetical protein